MAKTQRREQNNTINHAEKTEAKKQNFGGHQTEEGQRPSESEDLGLDKYSDG